MKRCSERCGFPYRVILVASDLTPGDKNPLRHALGLARCHGASVHLVHVMAGREAGRTLFFLPLRHPPEFMEKARAKARRKIEDFLRGEELEGVDFHSSLLEGRPCEEILRYAEKAGADLLVVGARGSDSRAGHLFTHFPVEGTCAELRRRAPLCVLVVR